MIKKSVLAIAAFVALPATAQAGSTISDRSYWPNEATRTTATVISPRDLNSAFAYDRRASGYGPSVITGGPALRYQGGPKSH